ncbi:sulfotransferase domain-containing protein [Roseomonas frigidaquae]|uniref:Sulfotransferase domain-containing protein n=1 Tax=Falsiroseomonas frigidaquae TaxID=487318 RepID=A0ABX1ERK5_9PROT|nr:sulfotransferase domain-containing protein [Falsiroseomonas frigidaquae]NKE43217.1 sulfotransferase domain-containing protein [Falsiroseomonas frigidaquae]
MTYVLTHHKCASAWLARYLGAYARMNGLSLSATHLSAHLPEDAAQLVLLANAAYPFLAGRIPGGIHIIRNPLDLVVSAYHSHRNTHPTEGWPQLAAQQDLLRRVPAEDGLLLTLAFLERADFHPGAVGPLHALRHWDFDDARFVTLRMEDVVQRPTERLGGLLKASHPGHLLPPADQHSFAAVAGRPPGQVDAGSHYRAGTAGQWRSELPDSAIGYLRAHLAPLLHRFYPETLPAFA